MPPTLRRSKAQARGFSLLEVAIALVIFVFGALAIVRIFPGALRVITVGGSRQNALSLNRSTMARVQLNPPAATYDVGQNSSFTWVDGYQDQTTNNFEPRAVLGSTRRGYSLPRQANQSDVDNSALGSVRAIVGEPSIVRVNNGQLFVFTQFPIFDTSVVQVNERASMSGVTINSAGNLDFTDARWSSSGEQADFIQNATYYVTCRYIDKGQLWGLSDFPATASTSTSTTAQVALPSTTATEFIAGQVNVVCQRVLDAPILIPTTPSPSPSYNATRGIVPDLAVTGATLAGNIYSKGTSTTLAAGDQVFVDYQADWGRILQEGTPDTVPEALATPIPAPTTPRQIALAAPFIEDHATDAVTTVRYSKSSNIFVLGQWGEGVTTTDVLTPTNADLRASRITFDMGNDLTATARVSYRTRDNWSQQLSVAAASYKPFTDGGVEPWRDYVLLPTTGTPKGIIYFHASEAGKSVMVTYTYKTPGAMGSSVTLRNRLLSISDDQEKPVGLPATFTPRTFGAGLGSGYAARLDLTDANGDNLDDVGDTLSSISGVRGASVTVRTAWLDGSRYTQSFLTAMRAGTGAEAMP